MYVIRYNDLIDAIEPARNLIKLSDPNLWKPAWPEGIESWQQGHEIRSGAIGISLFKKGTKEKPHYHERTWELYQPLEGSLRIAVKQFRTDSWRVVVLDQYDILLLAPGTRHLVDAECEHTTQVIKAPPIPSDQFLIEDELEIEAAKEILEDIE
jgi:hypothetical protein